MPGEGSLLQSRALRVRNRGQLYRRIPILRAQEWVLILGLEQACNSARPGERREIPTQLPYCFFLRRRNTLFRKEWKPPLKHTKPNGIGYVPQQRWDIDIRSYGTPVSTNYRPVRIMQDTRILEGPKPGLFYPTSQPLLLSQRRSSTIS